MTFEKLWVPILTDPRSLQTILWTSKISYVIRRASSHGSHTLITNFNMGPLSSAHLYAHHLSGPNSDHRSRDLQVLERACLHLPRSYKLWRMVKPSPVQNLDPATDRRIVSGIPGQASSKQEPCRARGRIRKSQRLVREGAYSTE